MWFAIALLIYFEVAEWHLVWSIYESTAHPKPYDTSVTFSVDRRRSALNFVSFLAYRFLVGKTT